LSASRSEASLWFSSDGEESDDAVDVAPATTPRRPTPARPRTSIRRSGSRRLTAALLSWQRSVVVPESLFSELEGKRRRQGSGAPVLKAPRFVCAPDSFIALVFAATGFLLTLTHVALLTPIFVAFDAPMRLGGPDPWPWTAVADFAVGAFFLASVLANFRTGVLVSSETLGRTAAVLNPRDIARVYVKSGTFSCDVVALIPLFAQCIASVWLFLLSARSETKIARRFSRTARALRLFHLTRLRKLFGATVGNAEAILSRETWTSPLFVWLLQTACEFAFVINICACAFVSVARAEGFEHSWALDLARADDGGALDAPVSDIAVFVGALYWAAATVTTVGYGDISATNTSERVVASVVMTVGATWFAYLVGAVAALVDRHSSNTRRKNAYREKMIALRCFLNRHPNVPRELRLRLVHYFSETWVRRQVDFSDDALLSELPEELRDETRFRAFETDLREAFSSSVQNATTSASQRAENADRGEPQPPIVSERALRVVADALVPRVVPRDHAFDVTRRFVLVNKGEVSVSVARGASPETSPETSPNVSPDKRTRRNHRSMSVPDSRTASSRALMNPDAKASWVSSIDRAEFLTNQFIVTRGGTHACIGIDLFCSANDRSSARRRFHVLEAVAVTECEVYELDSEKCAKIADEFPDLRKGAQSGLANLSRGRASDR